MKVVATEMIEILRPAHAFVVVEALAIVHRNSADATAVQMRIQVKHKDQAC